MTVLFLEELQRMVHTIELGGYSRSLYALTTDCRNAGTSTAVTPCREPSDYMYTAPWLMHLRHLPAAYTRLTACRNGPLDLHFFYNNNNSRYNYSYSEVTT